MLREEEREFAKTVYLGEVPVTFYDDHGDYPVPSFAVYNPSRVELHQAWIEGKNGKDVRIQGIQSCSFYTAPPTLTDGTEFDPIAVHFADPQGTWRYHIDDGLDRKFVPWPDDKSSDGASEAFPVENCG